jgi:hypothetical protein
LEELAARVEITVADNAINVIQLLAMMQLIHGMNDKYSQFKYALALDDRLSTFAACKSRVLEQLEREELELKSRNKSYDNYNSSTVLQVKSEGKETRNCKHCHKAGHIENDCWKKYPEKNPRSTSNYKISAKAIKVDPVKPSRSAKKTEKLQAAISKAVESYKNSNNIHTSEKLWQIKLQKVNERINAIKKGYIEFVADSAADVTVKKGDGNGLDNFDPQHTINIE